MKEFSSGPLVILQSTIFIDTSWTREIGPLVILQRAIGLISKVFVSGLEDQGSILGRVIPKT